MMKIIAFEEHFTTKEHVDAMSRKLAEVQAATEPTQIEKALKIETMWLPTSQTSETLDNNKRILDCLLDIDEGRLRQMDEAGIDMQVLSLMMSGVQVLDAQTGIATARKINDRLSEIVKGYPGRFAGLATIPPQAPEEAAKELERAVVKLGLKGTCINSHIDGEYLDDKKYWPIFEAAARLNVPIYIHPRLPSPDMIKPYLAYPTLPMALWGYAAEEGLHSMRLICSGVFDEYPKLKIVLGHLGESLPFWLWRLDDRWQRSPMSKSCRKKPSEYIKENFLVTTSGMFWPAALQFVLMALGPENILFATDYPFESSQMAVDFVKSLPVSDSEKEKLCYLNAKRLLKLP